MNKSVASIKNKNKIKMVEPKVGPKHSEETYYRMYIKEKKERKRYQKMVGEIDDRVEKVNKENEQIFTEMQIDVDYWKFSFQLATTRGVDFLNYEIGLIKKGLMIKEENKTD